MLCRNRKCQKEYSGDFTHCPWCGTPQTPEKRKRLRRANGTGSIYRLSGRRKRPWAVVSTINGKQSYIGYFATKTEAIECLARYSAKPKSERYNMTLGELYREWLKVYARTLSKAGIECKTTAWARLCVLENEKMRDLKTIDYQQVIDNATVDGKTGPRPLSRSGKEKIKQLISQLCQKAMEYDIIDKNYAEFILLEEKPAVNKGVFSVDEIRKLYNDATQNNDYTSWIILSLIFTGLRINELFGIELKNVYLEDGYMIGGEKTQAGKNRVIPIHNILRPFFMQCIAGAVPGQIYLLCNKSGKQINDDNFRKRAYYPKLEQLQLQKLNPHRCRNTFATYMRKGGVREEVLSQIIGHVDFDMTDKYIIKDLDDMKQAIDLFQICK